MVPSYNIHINKYVIRGLLQMPIKLIENMCTKETKKTTNTQKPKKLKASNENDYLYQNVTPQRSK